jgi:L-iditol 2-dehydrogenase
MKAAVLIEPNKLVIDEVPTPEPTEFGDVVVKIKSCGICQTDQKAITGRREIPYFPAIVGHEPSGIVAKVGPGVTHVKEGDPVICMPVAGCGYCSECRSGRSHYCKNAFTTGGDGPDIVLPGAFSEFMLTKDVCLFHKPKKLSFDAAALAEPLSGAWKGVIQYSEMQVGDNVIIVGTGSIGMLCMMVAKAAGAGTLIVIDPSPYAQKLALELGADFVISPSETIREEVYAIIPKGPDLIVEAAGSIQAVELMISLRRRGTRWNLFGITTHEKFSLDGGYNHFLEARMDASFGTNPLAMTKAIRLMEKGLVDTEKIISHRFNLDDINEAMKIMETPNRNKIIIKM